VIAPHPLTVPYMRSGSVKLNDAPGRSGRTSSCSATSPPACVSSTKPATAVARNITVSTFAQDFRKFVEPAVCRFVHCRPTADMQNLVSTPKNLEQNSTCPA